MTVLAALWKATVPSCTTVVQIISAIGARMECAPQMQILVYLQIMGVQHLCLTDVSQLETAWKVSAPVTRQLN